MKTKRDGLKAEKKLSGEYTQCIVLKLSFITGSASGGFEPHEFYMGYNWHLARSSEDDELVIVAAGYA